MHPMTALCRASLIGLLFLPSLAVHAVEPVRFPACFTFRDAEDPPDRVRSDGLGPYCGEQGKVFGVFYERIALLLYTDESEPERRLTLDLTDVVCLDEGGEPIPCDLEPPFPTGFVASGTVNLGLRNEYAQGDDGFFDTRERLNFAAMEVGETSFGFLAIHIDSVVGAGLLGFGEPAGPPTCPFADPVMVTRTTELEWSVEASAETLACFYIDGAFYSYVFMPFQFTVVNQDPYPDFDEDGTPDAEDNCRFLANRDQADADGDGLGDVCDNCPMTSNPDQEDLEPTRWTATLNADNGFSHELEPGVRLFRTVSFSDETTPGFGSIKVENLDFGCGPCSEADFCDLTREIGNGSGVCGLGPRELAGSSEATICARSRLSGRLYDIELATFTSFSRGCVDADGGESCAAADGTATFRITLFGDGVGTACDNCPETHNRDQSDADGDGRGDVCDTDAPVNQQLPSDCDQDGTLNISDGVCLLGNLFFGEPARLPCGSGLTGDPPNVRLFDSNGDERVNLADAVYVLSFLFSGTPGPVLGTECVPVAGCPAGRGCD